MLLLVYVYLYMKYMLYYVCHGLSRREGSSMSPVSRLRHYIKPELHHSQARVRINPSPGIILLGLHISDASFYLDVCNDWKL